MKKIIALSVLALALTGCAAKEEEVAVEAAPAAEAPAAEAAPAAEVVAEEAPAAEAAPAAEVGGVPQDVAAQ